MPRAIGGRYRGRASVGAELPPGSAVVLSLRPEHVVVGDGRDGAECFLAQLLEVIYLGDHCKLRMRVAGSDDFIAKVPAKGVDWKSGEMLTVSWPAHACLALPTDWKG